MDPNASTDVPVGYSPVPLSKTTTLVIKFWIFGVLAIVLSSAIAFGLYLVFFKEKHHERKAARRDKIALELEQGIFPKSRHYPIGKVPKTKNKVPSSQPPGSSAHDTRPSLSRSSSRSSKQSTSSFQSYRRSCRVTRAPDPLLDIPKLPKTLTSQKLTESTTYA